MCFWTTGGILLSVLTCSTSHGVEVFLFNTFIVIWWELGCVFVCVYSFTWRSSQRRWWRFLGWCGAARSAPTERRCDRDSEPKHAHTRRARVLHPPLHQTEPSVNWNIKQMSSFIMLLNMGKTAMHRMYILYQEYSSSLYSIIHICIKGFFQYVSIIR